MTPAKSKFAFNVVDLIIVVLVLCVIVLSFYLLFIRAEEGYEPELSNAQLTITVYNVPQQLLGNINTGHRVRTGDEFTYIGTIIDIQYTENRVRTGFDTAGRPVYRSLPTYVTLKLTLDSNVYQYDDRFLIGDFTFNVGSQIEVMTPYFWGVGVCSNITLEYGE